MTEASLTLARAGDEDAFRKLTDSYRRELQLQYQGPTAIGAFLRDREVARGRMRLVPTRANTQPAFAAYLLDPEAGIGRPYSLFVLALEGDGISAVTWFAGPDALAHFGLPQTLQ